MLDATRPDWVTALTVLFSVVMVIMLARGLWQGRGRGRRRDRDDRDPPR